MPGLEDTTYGSAGVIGSGSQLLVGNGASPETFIAIAGARSISIGWLETGNVDKSHLRSLDAHREHMPAIRDNAEITVDGLLQLDSTTQNNTSPNGLLYLWRSRAVRNFKVRLSDAAGSELPFRGYVKRVQIGELGVNTVVPYTVVFRPIEDYTASWP